MRCREPQCSRSDLLLLPHLRLCLRCATLPATFAPMLAELLQRHQCTITLAPCQLFVAVQHAAAAAPRRQLLTRDTSACIRLRSVTRSVTRFCSGFGSEASSRSTRPRVFSASPGWSSSSRLRARSTPATCAASCAAGGSPHSGPPRTERCSVWSKRPRHMHSSSCCLVDPELSVALVQPAMGMIMTTWLPSCWCAGALARGPSCYRA